MEQSQSEQDKIRVLKAMGNCGAKELVVPIKSVIDDKSEQLVVRTQAVFALRKIAKHFNKLVRTSYDELRNYWLSNCALCSSGASCLF